MTRVAIKQHRPTGSVFSVIFHRACNITLARAHLVLLVKQFHLFYSIVIFKYILLGTVFLFDI